MPKRLRVALDVETSLVYGRRILEGVSRYLRANRPWSIYLEQHELGSDLPGLAQALGRRRHHHAAGDAEFGQVAQPATLWPPSIWATSIRLWESSASARPTARSVEWRPSICWNAASRTSAAAALPNEHWSQRRRDGFVAEIQHAGFECSVYESPRAGLKVWKQDQTKLVEWLQSLPKPVGIFATNDLRGQHVLDACARDNVAVPEQVAVIGVDNDELLVQSVQPAAVERDSRSGTHWLRSGRMARPDDAGRDAEGDGKGDSAAGHRRSAIVRRVCRVRSRVGQGSAIHSRTCLRRRDASRICWTTCASREAGWSGISASC